MSNIRFADREDFCIYGRSVDTTLAGSEPKRIPNAPYAVSAFPQGYNNTAEEK